MRRKRKSDPKVDEVEDGGRAIVIEEGISAMVFSYAEGRNFLEGAAGVNYDLLRTIKDMTSHLEVRVRTAGEWERAIMTGFDIWRQVKTEGRGRIRADLERRTNRVGGVSHPIHRDKCVFSYYVPFNVRQKMPTTVMSPTTPVIVAAKLRVPSKTFHPQSRTHMGTSLSGISLPVTITINATPRIVMEIKKIPNMTRGCR